MPGRLACRLEVLRVPLQLTNKRDRITEITVRRELACLVELGELDVLP
jgi:hypothetical protein